MENLSQVQPPLPGTVAQGFLAGGGLLPPPHGTWVPGHFLHVRIKILACIFKVGEEQILMQKDGIIPDVAIPDFLQHTGPGVGVEPEVIIFFIRFQADDLGESSW